MKFVIQRSPTNMSPSPTHQKKQQVPTSPTSAISGYYISECIGYGSFSTVYKAHKNRGKYEVAAIKCIQISTLSKKSKDNLINEINILRRIDHQHVVSMRKFTWDARYIYLILDYCPGGNLSEFIKSKGKLSEFMVQHFAQQLVQGLEVLHAENIVHSDLKPDNILLSIPPVGSCRNVKLKIADFGLSRRLQNDEKYTIGMKGSLLYMAPEVLKNEPYTSKADLYSLGLIIYECLNGTAPYRHLDYSKLSKQIISPDPIRIPSTLDISENCYDLLERLLVKNQEKRINFKDLYGHPFIDIEHCPTIENYYKGVNMVRQATIMDNARNYEDARAFYVEGLLYLVPVYHWLDSFNDNQRKWLSRRVQEYFTRAEQISPKACQ